MPSVIPGHSCGHRCGLGTRLGKTRSLLHSEDMVWWLLQLVATCMDKAWIESPIKFKPTYCLTRESISFPVNHLLRRQACAGKIILSIIILAHYSTSYPQFLLSGEIIKGLITLVPWLRNGLSHDGTPFYLSSGAMLLCQVHAESNDLPNVQGIFVQNRQTDRCR